MSRKDSQNDKEEDIKRSGTLETQEDKSEDKSTEKGHESQTSDRFPLKICVHVKSLAIHLNKEHQKRRLLDMVLSDTALNFTRDHVGQLEVSGRVGNIHATNPELCHENQDILLVRQNSTTSELLNFRYCTYKRGGGERTEVNCDDFLSVKINSVQFVYIKARAAELVDYLSNGLPGKGMGFTHKAAKGFLGRKTKSTMEITIDSPVLVLPRHESTFQSVKMKLGDVKIKSWYEEGTLIDIKRKERDFFSGSYNVDNPLAGNEKKYSSSDSELVLKNDWWRCLTLDIIGIGNKNWDINLRLWKPCWYNKNTIIRARMSYVEFVLNYSDWVLFRAVLKDNITAPDDKASWDGIDDIAKDTARSDNDRTDVVENDTNPERFENHVVYYSSGARFIRYGNRSKREVDEGASHVPLDCKFILLGCCVTIHRNDNHEISMNRDSRSSSLKFNYDIARFRAKRLIAGFLANEQGQKSINFSLFRLDLLDLGDEGRLHRELQLGIKKQHKRHCLFPWLLDGYDGLDEKQPQLVVSIKTAPKKDPEARIVINYLSMNGLVRPLMDIVRFLSCSWLVEEVEETSIRSTENFNENDGKAAQNKNEVSSTQDKSESSTRNGFKLKLEAHYPRVFFIADESDANSRALVLRGLAIVNLRVKNVQIISPDHSHSDTQTTTSLQAHFHSMESYINPNVSLSGLGLGLGANKSIVREDHFKNNGAESLGIALIEPVTATFEFMQVERKLHPITRSISFVMDPVSTMISYSDVSLIGVVLGRWGAERDKSKKIAQDLSVLRSRDLEESLTYNVTFTSSRLGLVLRKSAKNIIVDGIKEKIYSDEVGIGDHLIAIEDDSVIGKPFKSVIQKLSNSPRPVTLTFASPFLSANVCEADCSNSDTNASVEPNDSVSSKQYSKYTISFRPGKSHGLHFTRGICGDVAVLKHVDAQAFTDAVDMKKTCDHQSIDNICEKSPENFILRIPPPGAIVLALNGIQLGYRQTVERCASYVSCHVSKDDEDEICMTTRPLELTFLEADTSNWSIVDKINISVEGFKMDVIDDIGGKDMPILRGTLEKVNFKMEHGLGLRTKLIRVPPPSIFITTLEQESVGSKLNSKDEEVLKVHSTFRLGFEYYNPKVAVWEPLIEPCSLDIYLEYAKGSFMTTPPRPSNLAVSLSDGGDENISDEFVRINFSDAGLEMLIRAYDEWRSWKDAERNDDTYLSQSVDSINETVEEKQKMSTLGAGAALQFAKKNKAEVTKPFVLRNKTGLPIAFVQQTRKSLRPTKGAKSFDDSPQNVPVTSRGYNGFIKMAMKFFLISDKHEYFNGLDEYDPEAVTEVASDEEARFNMEVFGENSLDQANKSDVKRATVRAYGDALPRISIFFDPILGVLPLVDLPVSKVGQTICRLPRQTSRHDFILVAWNVSLQQNRRILTISSAICVESMCCGVPLEIAALVESDQAGLQEVVSLGFAEPKTPVILPLWLGMVGRTSIRVRPLIEKNSEKYEWSQSFFEFAEVGRLMHTNAVNLKVGATYWQWRHRENAKLICTPNDPSSLPVFLYYTDSSDVSAGIYDSEIDHGIFREENSPNVQGKDNLLCIYICSSMSIRNLLPFPIDWELSNSNPEPNLLKTELIDSGLLRKTEKDPADMNSNSNTILGTGCGVEVMTCDFSCMLPFVRFRFPGCDNDWTSWTFLKKNYILNKTDDDDDNSIIEDKCIDYQMTVSALDGNGVPFVISIKIIPKITGGAYDGLNLILFTELWIKNLTPLNLAIGAPSSQLFGSNNPVDKDSSIIAAETAIMELVSVLEFEGNAVNKDDSQVNDIIVLPGQDAEKVCEEVFEFIEVDSMSNVLRRWWASEFNSSRKRPGLVKLPDSSSWKWDKQGWKKDFCGFVDGEGWESCTNLLVGFSKYRTFDESHPYRRRRWVCTRERVTSEKNIDWLWAEKLVVHQPAINQDQASEEQAQPDNNSITNDSSLRDIPTSVKRDEHISINIKCGDGSWSDSVTIPSRGGASNGIIRLRASRWAHARGELNKSSEHKYALYELIYNVQPLDGAWGEYTRLMKISPRIMLHNDSDKYIMHIKQAGSADDSLLRLKQKQSSHFYWSSSELPDLICVKPGFLTKEKDECFCWSGVFSVNKLGMTALRVRCKDDTQYEEIRTIRAHVYIRSKTGGAGINISFREEDPLGKGSLYRIENMSPWPVWIGQDGLVANPNQSSYLFSSEASVDEDDGVLLGDSDGALAGDIVKPMSCLSFGLDAPLRRSKPRALGGLSVKDVLLRVALAPLGSREGEESMKVMSFTVGTTDRLSPSKLCLSLSEEISNDLLGVRVIGCVCTDGPSKVIRFSLMKKDVTTSGAIGNAVRRARLTSIFSEFQTADGFEVFSTGLFSAPPGAEKIPYDVIKSTHETMVLLKNNRILSEKEALHQAFYGRGIFSKPIYEIMENATKIQASDCQTIDTFYDIQTSFKGFIFSIIDSEPTEIAVASLRYVDARASWNTHFTREATVAITVGWLQVDNHLPNAPFPTAVYPQGIANDNEVYESESDEEFESLPPPPQPFIAIGATLAPKHNSGIPCFHSVTVSAQDIAVAVDLAFIVRTQRFILGVREYFGGERGHLFENLDGLVKWTSPDLPVLLRRSSVKDVSIEGSARNLYFESITFLPFNISLSVAQAKALTSAQAALEGPESASIHAAVRKGDVLVNEGGRGLVGVKIGGQNSTVMAVIRGLFKSMVVDALLRCDSAVLSFPPVALRNHIACSSQLGTFFTAHYLAALRSNVPAILGSLAAFGNVNGLIRNLGDGVADFVSEPIKGFKKSVAELNPIFVVDGVAKGTGSLARNAVGGIAGSASLITDTLSKNMAVLTLDRKYAQKRDRAMREGRANETKNIVDGLGSGGQKIFKGVLDGVTGAVRYPIRGAEKDGVEGFAKGVGKGLLGLVVKPFIGLTDAATDVMKGVKSSVEADRLNLEYNTQIRPRRCFYGKERSFRSYHIKDATAAALMLTTSLAGELYLTHCDMGSQIALLSVRRILILGEDGREKTIVRFSLMKGIQIQEIPEPGGEKQWGLIILLKEPRKDLSEVEVINCGKKTFALDLYAKIKDGCATAGIDDINL